jgi:hypothetical protein
MPALAAIGALDVVVISLCAILLVAGVYMLFRPVLAGALGSIPVIGGWVTQNTDLLLARVYVAGVEAAFAALGPLADLLHRAAAVENTLSRYIVGSIDNTFNTMWRLRYQVLPAQELRSAEYARALASAAVQYAQALAVQVAQQAEARVQQAIQYAQALTGQAIQYAQALTQAAEARSEARTLEAERYAQALAQQAEAFTVAETDRAVRYSEQLAMQAIDYARLGDLEAERFTERVGAQANDYARALERVAVDHADAVGAATAAAAAAATAVVAARVAQVEDSPCQRFCNPLGDLGQLLQGLEDAGLLAVLVGLVQEVRHDPAAVQRVLREDVVPLGRDALSALGLDA